MQRRIARLNRSLAADLARPLRIGVHAGLEGVTKAYGCVLVASAETLRHTGVDPKDAPLHQVRVRGRTERIAVYAVSDPRMLFGEVTA